MKENLEKYIARVYIVAKLAKSISPGEYSLQTIDNVEIKNQFCGSNFAKDICLNQKSDGDFTLLYDLNNRLYNVTYLSNIFNIKDSFGINVNNPYEEIHNTIRLLDTIKQIKLNNQIINMINTRIGNDSHYFSLFNKDYLISRPTEIDKKRYSAQCIISKVGYNTQMNKAQINHSFYINQNHITRIDFKHGFYDKKRIIQSSCLSNELINVIHSNFSSNRTSLIALEK